MRRKLGGDAIAGAAALIVILVLAFAQQSRTGKPPVSSPSSYDTGRYGYGALYELLKRENLHPQRFERNHHFLRDVNGTLIAAQSAFDALGDRPAGISKNDVLAIKFFAERGGHVIVLAPPYGSDLDTLVGIPASRTRSKRLSVAFPFAPLAVLRGVHSVRGSFDNEFAWSATRKAVPLLATPSGIVAMRYRLGRGTVTVLTDPFIFANEHLAQADNARFAVQLIGAHAGAVSFDETIHGYDTSNGLWSALPWPVQLGAWLLGFALLLGIAGNIVRFAPPVAADRVEEPDSSAYITSMANLLLHADARTKGLHDVADSALRAARRALGIPERAAVSVLLERVRDPLERSALLELDRLGDLQRPTNGELLRAGVLAARLRKETGT